MKRLFLFTGFFCNSILLSQLEILDVEQFIVEIEAANLLDNDLAIFGNHEFNYGLPFLKEAITQSNLPWSSGKIYTKEGTPPTKPFVIKEGFVKRKDRLFVNRDDGTYLTSD